jgi:GrpB-like predicted nucleotidyltransferase (UPF0157 family)
MSEGIFVVAYDDAWPVIFAEVGVRLRRELGDTALRIDHIQPGERRTHIHVRRAGSFSEQFALLFREFLRSYPDHTQQYAELKRRLAKEFSSPEQRSDYVEAKMPFIWHTMHLADEWAQSTGWEPPSSDC